MGKAERRKKDSNMAAYMKKHGIQRGTFRSFCGHLIGIGQTNILRHFATCRK